MAKQIVWKDLDKRTGLFTTRNTSMVNLDNNSIIQVYGANTKINLVQETEFNGVKYFRTETAATQGLNWAFKASDFGLPELKVASLEPSKKSFEDNSFHLKTHSMKLSDKNVSKTPKPSESEEKFSEERKISLLSAFKRFLRRKK